MDQPQQKQSSGVEALLNLQPGSSVSVAYHSLFGPHDDLILLELDEKLLPDVLHQRVSLRGETDEDAVLCTQSKTYAIKFVGTSNSPLLVPASACYPQDCEGTVDGERAVAPVIKVVTGNMELVEVAPRLDKLKSLLLEKQYSSHELLDMNDFDDFNKKARLYRWDDLVNRIQASDDELLSGLQALSAVEINGYWRIVDEKYMDMILRMLLHNIVLNDWSFNALNADEVVSVLVSDGFPSTLALHCLRVYGREVDEAMSESSVWRLDERQVCIHFARETLRAGKLKMDNFMTKWLQVIPDGMQASFDMLEGEVLTEKIGAETWVHAFSISSLPTTPAERFSMLFRERPKWEWKDLEPYIRDLKVPGLSSEGLLLKYARRTQPTQDVQPVFSAR